MMEPECSIADARNDLAEAAIAAAGMCLFALFVHDRLPWRMLALAGLVVAALALHRAIVTVPSPADLLGLRLRGRRASVCLVAGLALGAGLAVLLRWRWDAGPLPGALHVFVIPAALIGMAEELVYRGYVQGRLRVLKAPWAMILAAAAHTAYKCALFCRADAVAVNYVFLAPATMLGGMAFGALRALAGSVWPAVAAHACFDVLVYGDCKQAPWWVWQ